MTAPETLTPFEALMYRAEANPMMRSTSVLIEILDSVPDHDRIIRAHEWASRLLTPLRHRIVEDPLRLSAARWVVDRDFDLRYHLRFGALEAPGTIEQACEYAQVMAMAPFDTARPLWEAAVLSGLEGGRAVYILKLHHAIADGQGFVQLFDILHSDTAEPGRARDLPVPSPQAISGRTLAINSLTGLPRRAVRDSLRVAGAGLGAATTVIRRPRAILDAARYAQSFGRMLGPPPTPGSVLLAQRSLGRRYRVCEAPLPQLKAAGKSAGGTLNDAFLAALTGAMRRYHEHHGVPIEALSLALPISVRRPDDPVGSNRFAAGRVTVPIAETDPAVRIRLISAAVREARAEPALGFMDAMAPVMIRLPGALAGAMSERVTRSIDLQASNVKGMNRTGYLAGARIERMYGFGAAPGPAVMVTLVSYLDICCISLTINAAAIPDPETFVRCLEESLDEVLALAPAADGRRAGDVAVA